MTTRASKQEILQALMDLIHHVPNQRFGQLIVNLAGIARGSELEDVWELEDEELLAAVRTYVAAYHDQPATI